MQVSNIKNNQNISHPAEKNNKSFATPNTIKSELGAFPQYYCPNISFNSAKFGSFDFEYDFYKFSHNIINNHLDEMELTKELSESEQEDFKTNLFSSDKTTLMHFMFDKKPSILLNGEFPYFKNNDKYSFVRRILDIPLKDNKSYLASNIFILNNELVKQTINENRELYTKRMGLDEAISTEKIYETLIGENSPLKEQTGYDDIVGITLGFSPINSILFQVEQDIPNKLEVRKRPAFYASELDKAFNSNFSTYKDFSEDFKTNVQSSIDFIKNNSFRKPDLGSIGYGYIHIAPDEKHTQKIVKDAEDVLEQAKSIA